MFEKYKPRICPICNSDDITYDGSEVDGYCMWYKCCCNKCNATFYECYELNFIGMEEIVKGDDDE